VGSTDVPQLILAAVSGRRDRFVAADPIRGLGALAVFVFHCGAYTGIQSALFHGFPWTTAGSALTRVLEDLNFGVYLFFTLSGYLIGRPFIEAFVDGTPFPRIPTYLRNRALRLLPGLLIVFLLSLLAFGTDHASWQRVLAVPLLIQVYFPTNFSLGTMAHYWTLDNEVLFYVLLPLLIWPFVRRGLRAGSRERRRRLLVAVLAAIFVVSVVLDAHVAVNDQARHEWFPMIAFAFTPGLALAVASTWVPERLRTHPLPRHTGLAMNVAAGAVFLYTSREVLSPGVLSIAGLGVASGLLVGAALLREWSSRAPYRAFDNRVMQWLGRRSYSFYLLHPIVIVEVVNHLHGGYGVGTFVFDLTVGLVCVLLATWLGYRVMEQPFLNRRKAWNAFSGTATAHQYEPR
jgi:peptidoglycan/LPS O-acetylase OafA/YrhL